MIINQNYSEKASICSKISFIFEYLMNLNFNCKLLMLKTLKLLSLNTNQQALNITLKLS
jgi:hypothetical protein